MIYYQLDYHTDTQQVNESFLYKSHTHDFIDEQWIEKAKELALDKYYSIFDFEPNDLDVEATVFRIDLEDYVFYKNQGLKELNFL